MVRTQKPSRDKPSPFKFQKGERVLVCQDSLIYNGNVQDRQVLIYNHNKNKYLIRLYEDNSGPYTISRELWMFEELVLKYDDAGLAKKEKLQQQANISNNKLSNQSTGGNKNSSSAGPSASNSSGFKESNKRACDDLSSTPDAKRRSSKSEDSNSTTHEEDPTVDEWANYGRDFGKKVGKLDEDTRREIRFKMESMLYDAMKKK